MKEIGKKSIVALSIGALLAIQPVAQAADNSAEKSTECSAVKGSDLWNTCDFNYVGEAEISGVTFDGNKKIKETVNVFSLSEEGMAKWRNNSDGGELVVPEAINGKDVGYLQFPEAVSKDSKYRDLVPVKLTLPKTVKAVYGGAFTAIEKEGDGVLWRATVIESLDQGLTQLRKENSGILAKAESGSKDVVRLDNNATVNSGFESILTKGKAGAFFKKADKSTSRPTAYRSVGGGEEVELAIWRTAFKDLENPEHLITVERISSPDREGNDLNINVTVTYPYEAIYMGRAESKDSMWEGTIDVTKTSRAGDSDFHDISGKRSLKLRFSPNSEKAESRRVELMETVRGEPLKPTVITSTSTTKSEQENPGDGTRGTTFTSTSSTTSKGTPTSTSTSFSSSTTYSSPPTVKTIVSPGEPLTTIVKSSTFNSSSESTGSGSEQTVPTTRVPVNKTVNTPVATPLPTVTNRPAATFPFPVIKAEGSNGDSSGNGESKKESRESGESKESSSTSSSGESEAKISDSTKVDELVAEAKARKRELEKSSNQYSYSPGVSGWTGAFTPGISGYSAPAPLPAPSYAQSSPAEARLSNAVAGPKVDTGGEVDRGFFSRLLNFFS